jgi:hypothetical protein
MGTRQFVAADQWMAGVAVTKYGRAVHVELGSLTTADRLVMDSRTARRLGARLVVLADLADAEDRDDWLADQFANDDRATAAAAVRDEQADRAEWLDTDEQVM